MKQRFAYLSFLLAAIILTVLFCKYYYQQDPPVIKPTDTTRSDWAADSLIRLHKRDSAEARYYHHKFDSAYTILSNNRKRAKKNAEKNISNADLLRKHDSLMRSLGFR